MIDPKNITIFAIPYLTLCAVLYHIAYWDTFTLNGLSYISVSDIIKSSVYPFLSTSTFVLIGVFIGNYLASGKDDINLEEQTDNDLLKFVVIIVMFFLWVFLLYLLDKLNSEWKWTTWPFLAALPLNFILYNSKLLNLLNTTNRYRNAFISLLIYLPFFFYSSGKIESEKIQNNVEYKYLIRSRNTVTNNPIILDTIKYLGTTEKNVIFTDLKNESIFLLKSDNIDTLILKTKK